MKRSNHRVLSLLLAVMLALGLLPATALPVAAASGDIQLAYGSFLSLNTDHDYLTSEG